MWRHCHKRERMGLTNNNNRSLGRGRERTIPAWMTTTTLNCPTNNTVAHPPYDHSLIDHHYTHDTSQTPSTANSAMQNQHQQQPHNVPSLSLQLRKQDYSVDNTVSSNSWHTASFEDPSAQLKSFISPPIFKSSREEDDYMVLQSLASSAKLTKSHNTSTYTNSTSMKDSDSICTEEIQEADNQAGVASPTATETVIDQKPIMNKRLIKHSRTKLLNPSRTWLIPRRSKLCKKIIWTYTIQNSVNCDCIPGSIKMLLPVLAEWTRIKGNQMPKQRNLFCEEIVKCFQASQEQAEESFDFLIRIHRSERHWDMAFFNHVPLQSAPASLKEVIVRLQERGPCPRNKSDFFHLLHSYLKVSDEVTCSQAYDYFATHIQWEISGKIVCWTD